MLLKTNNKKSKQGIQRQIRKYVSRTHVSISRLAHVSRVARAIYTRALKKPQLSVHTTYLLILFLIINDLVRFLLSFLLLINFNFNFPMKDRLNRES